MTLSSMEGQRARWTRAALGALAAACLWASPPRAAAGAEADGGKNGAGRTRVAVTAFPLWLFARNLLTGIDDVELVPVWPAGQSCPHDAVYTPADQRRLLAADAVVLVGLGFDAAAEAVLRERPGGRAGLVVIDASARQRPDAPEEWIPNRLPEAFADRPLTRRDVSVRRMNPHYFAGPVEAARAVDAIARGLANVARMTDPQNRRLLESNRVRYRAELEKLAQDMKAATADFGNRRLATQHDAFAYLARDLDLRVVAVLEENPGHPAPPSRVRAMLTRLVERGAGAVFLEPGADEAAFENIREATRLPVGLLDPVAAGPLTASADHYQTTMRKNLEALSTALLHAPPPPPDSQPDPPAPVFPRRERLRAGAAASTPAGPGAEAAP